MSFKLPNRPSSGADVHELADFVELLALINGHVSAREIVAFLGREGESSPNDGCDDVDDENTNALEEVFVEIESRINACRSRYPFQIDATGNVLRYSSPVDDLWDALYVYLLLSTRLNMTANKVQAGIDGTEILEEVSSLGIRCYLGSPRAQSIVFGTASSNANFASRVDHLCNLVGEGVKFQNTWNADMNAKDDKLDVVAWLPFADGRASKVIIFGQCKTGTAWTDKLCQLQPTAFIKKWIAQPFLYDPIRAYIVSESVNPAKWSGIAIEGGVFFDRCRLIDCCDQIDAPLLTKMTTWNNAAIAFARPFL